MALCAGQERRDQDGTSTFAGGDQWGQAWVVLRCFADVLRLEGWHKIRGRYWVLVIPVMSCYRIYVTPIGWFHNLDALRRLLGLFCILESTESMRQVRAGWTAGGMGYRGGTCPLAFAMTLDPRVGARVATA